MASTKTELINGAISLISSYPQLATAGRSGSLFSKTAETLYDDIVSVSMESFVYGFGITSHPLANPVVSENLDYKVFNIPTNVALPFVVAPHDQLPALETFIGATGNRFTRLQSVIFSKLAGNKIKVYHPDAYTGDLSLGYVADDPDVMDMSSSFKLAVKYHIASQIALKAIQQKAVYQSLYMNSQMYFSKAKKFAIDNRFSYTYLKRSVVDSVEIATPAGTVAPITNKPVRLLV